MHRAALAEFKARHAGADYDRELSRFLANLRRELNGKLIFTNQGYRKADDYLPYADWDLTESLITWNGGVPRPWDDPRDPWSSIRYFFVNVIEAARARYPRVRFAHLNYGGADAVPLVVAAAKLFGDAGYVAGQEAPLYFEDLGAGEVELRARHVGGAGVIEERQRELHADAVDPERAARRGAGERRVGRAGADVAGERDVRLAPRFHFADVEAGALDSGGMAAALQNGHDVDVCPQQLLQPCLGIVLPHFRVELARAHGEGALLPRGRGLVRDLPRGEEHRGAVGGRLVAALQRGAGDVELPERVEQRLEVGVAHRGHGRAGVGGVGARDRVGRRAQAAVEQRLVDGERHRGRAQIERGLDEELLRARALRRRLQTDDLQRRGAAARAARRSRATRRGAPVARRT